MMNSSTRLDSSVFQLTPTRTRCDLVIIANGKKEKIASGLLNPFLSHLKTAQDQMAKGGYSIILEPVHGADAAWFTRGTLERFVRFVSTPEILERVYTIESEILQLEEAIAIQGNNSVEVEDSQVKPVENNEASRPPQVTNEEKAIVIYKPDTHSPETIGTTSPEGNSKVQLMKVLETRKSVLQKEQGMAFARAKAAGFEIENMPPLMSFAECFGAYRLMDACRRFKELWKRKRESGQWVEIEAAEAMTGRSDFSVLNASGIILSNVSDKCHNELDSENNGKAGMSPMDNQPSLGRQEQIQGQFPHHMFPPWHIHPPGGAVPMFQPYPMQGMPYYQSHPGNGPFFQPTYPTVEDPSLNGQRMGYQRHSMGSRDNHAESETCDAYALKSKSQDEVDMEKEGLQSQERRKKAGRSAKQKSSRVVIRNINYITSKSENSSDSKSQSSASETDEDGEFPTNSHPSKRKGSHRKSMNNLISSDKEATDVDGGYWQAFQNCLLRDVDEDRHVDPDQFAMEKAGHMRRSQNKSADDPLVSNERDMYGIQDGMTDLQGTSWRTTRMRKSSNDEFLVPSKGQSRDSLMGDQEDLQSSEINGIRGGYRRSFGDEFVFHRGKNHSDGAHHSSLPLAVNRLDHPKNNLDRRSLHDMNDDSYIVPYRSVQHNQTESGERNAIDIGSEFPSVLQGAEKLSNDTGNPVNYQPDELNLMPEREMEKGPLGYDPGLDYEMQAQTNGCTSLDKKNKEVLNDTKKENKKLDKNQKSKTPNSSERKKNVGPIRRDKPSKLSPLDEARARAERLRNYKADLQKMKKQKEEEEKKRLEALKIERQKRIAARGSSISALSSIPSQLAKKQALTKLSPISHKSSKFSDSEPGSSSPLQRFPIRTYSIESTDSHKASKSRSLTTGSQLDGNRLSQSSSSLPAPKKEKSDGSADSKASMARIRRLSEPKISSTTGVSSVKPQSTRTISKSNPVDGPQSKKMSAIMSLDRSKAATLPELKIKTTRGTVALKEKAQKLNENKPSVTSEDAQMKKKDDQFSAHDNGDENLVIEKNVVMLECENPFVHVVHESEENFQKESEHFEDNEARQKTEVDLDFVPIRAPVSLLTVNLNEAGRDTIESQSPQQPKSSKVQVKMVNSENLLLKSTSSSVPEETYQAPYARLSSFEDPCTGNLEYGKAPPTALESNIGEETVRAHVSDFRNSKLERIPEIIENPKAKEASKGFRRLLKFGKKKHSSASAGLSAESDNPSIASSDADDYGSNPTSVEVHTLKNLISQDETPTGNTTSKKSSRSFSLLSPFRSKTGEKKLTS